MIPLRKNKNWSLDEDDYLQEHWGVFDTKNIALKLDRSVEGIKVRAYTLGLGARQNGCGMYLNPRTISEIIDIDSKSIITWCKKGDLKSKHLKYGKHKYWQITLDDLWKFIKEYPERVNTSRFEEGSLGAEPKWMVERRKIDKGIPARDKKKWIAAEDNKLAFYYKNNYETKEIAKLMGRSISSIHHRANRNLGPVRRVILPWTDKEIQMMYEFEKQGMLDRDIAYEIGREYYHIVDKRKRLRQAGEYRGYK